ncbi:unnamed protein product [Prunus brigantina]
MYLKDMETTFNRPQRNNDRGMRNEKLSVFAQSAQPFGDPGRGESFSRNDMEVAHWFVLNNCDEIMAYLDEHEEMMKREHPSHLVARKHRELTWYDDDPYILANMATQIVYLDDPKAGNGWKVVQKMDHRNVYAIPELDPTDNDIDNVADQRFESSMENDAETLRDTNVIQEPFQIQGVSSIEIPIQSITIDLGDLPRYDVAVGPTNDDDVVIEEEEEEEEEDCETESDDSEDNESYYSSNDE